MKIIAKLGILSAMLGFAAAAFGNDPIVITEWPVPWKDTRPRDPYVDNLNRVWFVGQTGDYLAYLDPSSGNFKRFVLEPGTGPHNLIVDPKGMVWYAGNHKSHIGKLDPVTGRITYFSLAQPPCRI